MFNLGSGKVMGNMLADLQDMKGSHKEENCQWLKKGNHFLDSKGTDAMWDTVKCLACKMLSSLGPAASLGKVEGRLCQAEIGLEDHSCSIYP